MATSTRSPARTPAAATKTPRRRRSAARAEPLVPTIPAPAGRLAASEPALRALARQLQSLAGSVLGMAGTATDLGVTLAKSRLRKPQHKAAVERAGSLLHDLRQTAGLTVSDLGTALGLNDPAELALIESGKVAMPFELILRAASLLGRKDPVTFVMQFTRAYNPQLWATLENLGVGKLVVQGAREREFANLYRARDAGRTLSDAQFAQVLAFVDAAYDLALNWTLAQPAGRSPPKKERA